jgi:hypothetical protein
MNDVRCLIVYDYSGDEILTQQILHILIAILAIAIYWRISKPEKRKLYVTDLLLIPIFLALGLLFIVPNSSSAGMMSDRYCLMFFMFLIMWVASQSLPSKTIPVFIVLIIGFHFGLLFKHHNGVIRDLDNHAQTIAKTQEFIDKNSIVLPLNLSTVWIEPHFSNYLGIDKPMIILENYEASIGWFPLQWRMADMPDFRLGDLQKTDRLSWLSNPDSKAIRQIDYVFIYGNMSALTDSSWVQFNSELKKSYKLVHASPDNYVNLYKLMH